MTNVKEKVLEILENFSYNSIGTKSVWTYYILFIRHDLYIDENPRFKETYRQKLLEDLNYLECEQLHVKEEYKTDYFIVIDYLRNLKIAQILLS